jgi:sec-independent protein translocase protein TatB
MFGIDFSEILVIFVIALVVLGPEKLPKLAATVGRWVGRARAMARQFREQLEQEAANIQRATDLRTPPPASPPPHTPPPAATSAPQATPSTSPPEAQAAQNAANASAPLDIATYPYESGTASVSPPAQPDAAAAHAAVTAPHETSGAAPMEVHERGG